MNIRMVRPDDREPLQSILRETGVFTADEVDIALELIDTAIGQPGQKDYTIHVCESGGVLGYTCVGPTPGTEGTFDLYWIAVKPSEQGRGVGAVLEEHACEQIRARGGRLVIAETSSTPRYDATRRFYLRRGYTEMARIPGYYRPGDDLVIYGKSLIQP